VISELPPVAVLTSKYRDTLWCAKCAGPREFVYEIFEFENGRLVCCQGCGDERVLRKSRVESEAA
jgi:hypothetical protein